jgi:hypothetical protein
MENPLYRSKKSFFFRLKFGEKSLGEKKHYPIVDMGLLSPFVIKDDVEIYANGMLIIVIYFFPFLKSLTRF